MGTKNNPGEFDCYANAEPDEPMFVLLARDVLAPGIVDEWVRRFMCNSTDRTREDGPSGLAARTRFARDVRKANEAVQCAQDMREWKDSGRVPPVRHPETILPEGPHDPRKPLPMGYAWITAHGVQITLEGAILSFHTAGPQLPARYDLAQAGVACVKLFPEPEGIFRVQIALVNEVNGKRIVGAGRYDELEQAVTLIEDIAAAGMHPGSADG